MPVTMVRNLDDDHDTGTHNHRDIDNDLRLHFERDTDHDSSVNDNEQFVLHGRLRIRLFLHPGT